MVSLKHFCQLTFIALFFVVCSALPAAAQQKPALVLPRPSQKASVMQTVGMTDITITYSRPGVKGRKIWGDATPAELANVKGAAYTGQSKFAASGCTDCALRSCLGGQAPTKRPFLPSLTMYS